MRAGVHPTPLRRSLIACGLLLLALGAGASDHIDNPGVVLEPATDLTDLFAFTDGPARTGSPQRLTVVLNAFLGAPAGARFSNAVSYEVHLVPLESKAVGDAGATARLAGALEPKSGAAGATLALSCTFGTEAAQTFTCRFGPENGPPRAEARGVVDRVPDTGGLRVFAGSRRDPFYIDEAKVQAKRSPTDPDAFTGANSTQFNDVLAIVADIDLGLLETAGPVLGVYGQVVLERSNSGSRQRAIVDRVGRPEITNITMRQDEAKFLWNHEETLKIAQSGSLRRYRTTLRDGILGLDGLDGRRQWTEQPATFERLLDLLVHDYLWLNLSHTGPYTRTPEPRWGHYLSMEWALLQGRDPLSAPGGRRLDDDIMDVMLTLEVSGLDGPLRTDGVPAPAVAASDTFPYLHEPFLKAPAAPFLDGGLTNQARPTAPADGGLTNQARPTAPADGGLTNQARPTAPADGRLTNQARPTSPADGGLTDQARPTATAASSADNPPLTRRELPTTDPAIFARNFDLRIASLEAQVRATGRHTFITCALLASDYQTRGQYTETLADFGRVSAITRECLDQKIDLPPIHALAAIGHMAMHRYGDAFRSLEIALVKGLEPSSFVYLLQPILWELGDRQTALGIVLKAAEAKPGVTTLARKGVVLSEMGRTKDAEQAFVQAQRHITDPNPFLLAWLNTQRGRLLLAERKPADARGFFEAALDRFPSLGPAEEGIAETFALEGQYAEAARRMERFVERHPADLRAQVRLLALQREGRLLPDDALASATKTMSERVSAAAAASPELAGLMAAEFFIATGETARAETLIDAELARTRKALEVLGSSAALQVAGLAIPDVPGSWRALALREKLGRP